MPELVYFFVFFFVLMSVTNTLIRLSLWRDRESN